MSENLPIGWITANLFDICQPSQWKTISISDLLPDGYTVYGANGVIGFYDKYTHEKPTIMITCRGATCGNIHVSKPFSYINGNAMALDGLVEKLCHLKYLESFLQFRNFQDVISGSAQPQITRANLHIVSIPLAPYEEQARIVEKLEELLTDLDTATSELKTAQKKLTQYRQSLLKAAVEGFLTGKDSYPKKSLGELVTSIGQGWSPRCDSESTQDDEIWAVMKTTAIQSLQFDGLHNKKLPLDLKPREHLELKEGDLLVTRAGPRNRVGITCLVRTTKKRLILCDKAYRIRCNKALINPEFLELALNAPHIVNEIDIKTGINDSGLNLTQDRFFTLMIPVPTLQEQMKVIESIQVAMLNIEQQTKSIAQSLKQAAAQRKNILKSAFSGQLVPQNPNDEPASVLLERIKAERAKQEAAKKPSQRKAKEVV